MAKYANKTSVSSNKSKMEIERTLSRYGATGFMYGWVGNSAMIAFEMLNRRIKFVLPLPDINSKDFTHTKSGYPRSSDNSVKDHYEQAIRQRWRALALVIKAKLEAVESGITEFESEFMAHIVLPNGQTVGEYMVPQIQKSYESKKMPPLLPKLN